MQDYQDSRGVVTYRLQPDGSLLGKWVVVVDGGPPVERLGEEVARPRGGGGSTPRIGGLYDVDLHWPDGQCVYIGTLEIIPKGPVFDMAWMPTTKKFPQKFKGAGMLGENGELVAAYWLIP